MTYLVVHSIQPVCRYYIPRMDQAVERTCALGQMRVVGIVRPDPIEDEIQTVGKVGHAGPETVEIEPVLDVRPLNLAEHLVSLETAEPLDPRLVVA